MAQYLLIYQRICGKERTIDETRKKVFPLSVKIRISYERADEVKKLLEVLQPYVKHMKSKNAPEGQYKKLYIDVRE